MNRTIRLAIPFLFLMLIVASIGCSQDSPASPNEIPTTAPESNTFVAVHFEAGYKGRIVNDLPIELPPEYLAMDFGWQEYHFETAQNLVQKADDYGFHLTLMFNPQWAEYFLQNSERVEIVRQWQERGHEIAYHHHSFSHPDWNGYSNDPAASSTPIYLGEVDAGLDFVRALAEPVGVTSVMVDGLPVDMPQSLEETNEDLIFTGGSQYDSFEQYGELRSLRPEIIIKDNGGTVVRVAHRQLTWMSDDISIEEALETFKDEYENMQSDEIYGVVFHCFDYLAASASYDEWFEFIGNKGDMVRSVSEVIADYEFDTPTNIPAENTALLNLHVAYPNPFNPETTLAFDLPEPAALNLSVFDVTGSLVRTLIDWEVVSKGYHESAWNGCDGAGQQVASGIYFYRLETKECIESKRMTLIK